MKRIGPVVEDDTGKDVPTFVFPEGTRIKIG